MNSSEKISVIVLMYNCAEYVAACMDSIINQTYKNWEVINVHGESTDNTWEICQEYSKKDKRIKNILYIEKKGPSPARWKGSQEASGEWIMFLDGDDWLDINCLQEVYDKAIEYNRPDFLFWKFEQVMDGCVIQGKWSFSDDKELQQYSGKECKELALQMMNYRAGLGESFAKLIRAQYCKQNDIFPNPNLRQGLEGWEFTLRLCYLAKNIVYIGKKYNKYRYNPLSLSKVVNEREIDYVQDCLSSMFDFCKQMDKDYQERMKRMLYQRALYTVLSTAMSTYFSPQNKESYNARKKKYKEALKRCNILSDSLKYGDFSIFDLKRKVSLYSIKHNFFFPLEIIGNVKYRLVKLGYFNY